MRLLCPNCDAEYEVEASLIPDTGRDVQCSNCGHAWFQPSPDVEAALAAEAALYDAPEPPPEPASAAMYPQTTVIGELPRRRLDESVLAVLREEADREMAARRAEAPQGLETQTELGLQAVDDTGGAVARRIARLKGEAAVPAVPVKPQSRREMLPEIDEINSSLRASSEKRGADITAVAPPAPAGGFRNGFVLMLLGAVALVTVYVMAPRIAQQMPGAAGALTAYVASIDGFRIMLDGAVQGAIEWLRGAADGAA